MMFGTKIFNNKTQEIGLVIEIWTNKYDDGFEEACATCVDKKGNKYKIRLDEITPLDD